MVETGQGHGDEERERLERIGELNGCADPAGENEV